MFEIRTLKYFDKWINKLKDNKLKAIIFDRLDRIHYDENFGDYRLLEDTKYIYELRIHYKDGYRIYFIKEARQIVILLCAGDKGRQKLDIKRAKEILNRGIE